MDRRDYILRMIEELGQILIELRNRLLGRGAGAEDVEGRLRFVAQQAGLDLDVARAVTAETLLALVAPTGDVEPGRCWLYAETLYLDGLTAALEGRPEDAWASYHKARFLFSMVKPLGVYLVGFPEASERIEEIDRRLAELEGGDGDPPGEGKPGTRHTRRLAVRPAGRTWRRGRRSTPRGGRAATPPRNSRRA